MFLEMGRMRMRVRIGGRVEAVVAVLPFFDQRFEDKGQVKVPSDVVRPQVLKRPMVPEE